MSPTPAANARMLYSLYPMIGDEWSSTTGLSDTPAAAIERAEKRLSEVKGGGGQAPINKRACVQAPHARMHR